ncbi:MAG TPA: hypothetical protein VKP69_30795, partial [Isosphaeraceae bacterium]|nr:hypothetical protein [Isosphaeraceae bacterium]
LSRDGEPLSPAAVAAILKEEGFAKLPRRLDDERPDQPRPVVADVADVSAGAENQPARGA